MEHAKRASVGTIQRVVALRMAGQFVCAGQDTVVPTASQEVSFIKYFNS